MNVKSPLKFESNVRQFVKKYHRDVTLLSFNLKIIQKVAKKINLTLGQ